MPNDFTLLAADERRLHLLGILDFDGVPKEDRLDYLMRTCKLSKYMAGRVLNGYMPRCAFKCFDLADALDVDCVWLWVGASEKYHPRTLRIHLQQVNHHPKNDVDQMLRLFVGVCAGYPKACNLAGLAIDGKMTMLSAARLM